jgi:hypothetical protein
MPAQTPEQCDELFGRYVNSRDLDNLVALYEAQASLGNEDGTVSSGSIALRDDARNICGLARRENHNECGSGSSCRR